jgi:hypothetical protein
LIGVLVFIKDFFFVNVHLFFSVIFLWWGRL